ncbi:MAG: ankyrin repeat domain-containing protein [Alphaproteobacteria bacterium]|nr:ankyrin repeat domain-containing protein [Alphaproteobacteria bacterium]
MVSNDNDLMKALYNEDFATIKTLLENGADVNKPYNSNGYTPFMFACREFYEPEVIELFLAHGGDVHSRNISGDTPFMIAAKKRSNPATLNLLLQAGSNINAQDNAGNTAFIKVVNHLQAMMRLGLIEFFINNDADVDIKNNQGKDIWDYVDNHKGLNEFILCTLLERCAND